MTMGEQRKLWSGSFVLAFMANFFMCFAFYMLMPTLPFYLIDIVGISPAMTGFVISIYVLAILAVRPFSGYLVDTFSRKPLYFFANVVAVAVICGYMFATALVLFVAMRIVHGLSWGIATTAGNTMAIDIMPSERRGEGIGYYGLSTNLAMALGPMIGLFIYNTYDINVVFVTAFVAGLVGLGIILPIKAPVKEKRPAEPISLDRFILVKGIPLVGNLFFAAFSYGVTISYVAMYGSAIGVSQTGLFFVFMAIGIGVSRLVAGKLVDKGYVIMITLISIMILVISYAVLAIWTVQAVYFSTAFTIGVGFGLLSPSFQTMIINLAPHCKRGTANSTYFTGYDMGIGVGILCGGQLIELWSYSAAFMVSAACNIIAVLMFAMYVGKYYTKNKLR